MTEPLLVSSIIPVYNGESFLHEAIESVLNQRYKSHEIIVLDDGSTDGTKSIAQSFGSELRYHHQANSGLGVARNEAIRLAKGSHVAFLDADDVWPEDKLLLQVNAVIANPSIDLVAGHVEHFYTPGLDESLRRSMRCPDGPQSAPVVPAMLVRRSVFEKTGPFETTWKVGVDLAWFLRVKELGFRVEVLPNVVLRRRLHAKNTGVVHSAFAPQRLAILKAALDRRRNAESKNDR